jgi:hypothetical protein
MLGEQGGWLWFVLDVIGVAILGLALAYGVMAWRKRRSRLANQVRDEATERLYHEKSEPEDVNGRRQAG